MGRILPRCWQAVASAPGTGAIVLGAALAGYQTLAAAGAANGDTISYWAVDGNAWECGQGSYSTTGPTLTRTTVEASSTGAALNLSASASIYCAPTTRDLAPKFAIDKPLDDQTLNASSTWTKPAVAGSWALVELWGGGMGGGKGATSGLRYGGTGGSYQQFVVPYADLPATASATIGAGGAGATSNAPRGAAGGTTSFLGFTCLGGIEDIYGDGTNYPSGLSAPAPVYKSPTAYYPPCWVGTSLVLSAVSPVADVQEQGGRGPVSSAVGASLFSGGRGAGATAANAKLAASASTNGGSGGDSAVTTNNTAGVAGSAPGGGGSAGTGTGNGGAGAAGRVRVRIY